MKDTFTSFNNAFNSFKDKAETALGNADDFYDSINGIHGLITWIIRNTPGIHYVDFTI